ncbi:MAG TPA: glycosyltransferase [Conexibacter sp.]|jgi:glycosyltransferase involved in cell wall biosynthesis
MNAAPLPPLPATPLVTVVTVTYNHERFIAESVESVLAQEWPADRLQYLVVNDGSTDATARALGPYRDRATVVDQENRGLLGALHTAMELADGDVIIVSEGDDAMKPGRIARVVQAFRDNPAAGLVYSDLELVDADGNVLAASFLDEERLPRIDGPPRGRLLHGNFVVGTACAIRGCLKPLVHPVPDHVQWWDYWWAWSIGGVAEVAHVPEALVRYRSHGRNQTLGLSDRQARALYAKELPFRRVVLGEVVASDGSPEQLLFGISWFWRLASHVRGSLLRRLVPARPDGAEALPLLAEAFAAADVGDYQRAALACCHAAALRPFDPALYGLVRELAPIVETPEDSAASRARAREREATAAAALEGRAILDELGARRFAALADAAAVVDAPDLLRAYAAGFDGDDDATLVIHADPASLPLLSAGVMRAIEASGLDGHGGPDMLLVSEPEPRLGALLAAADAQLGRAVGHGATGLFTSADIDSLRLVAERVWAPSAATPA